MSLLVTLLSGAGGGGGGSGGGGGTVLSPAVAASTATLTATYANGTSGIGATLTNGLTTLTAARVATTTALTVTYSNGTLGVGATLTNAGTQAAIIIDLVTLSVNDRVLVKNQASAAQNGVYSVTTVGTVSTNWVLTRVTDFDQAAEMLAGTNISITAGTTNTGTAWLLSTTVTTVGSDAVTFGATAAFTIDGQTPTVGQRVLIKNQTTAAQNGVYSVTTAGSTSALWVLTRVPDFSQSSQMVAGALIEVTSGTVNAGTVWELSAAVATVGSSSVTFVSINITTKVDQNGSPIYGASATGNDTYVITLSPAPSVYSTGMVINFNADVANTGNATLNVNGLGAKNILKEHDQTLADNDIEAGQIVTVIYDGTQFQMQSQLAQAPANSFAVLQSGSPIYGLDAVGTDTYAITLSPAPLAYTVGMVVNFQAGTANTDACSLNVNTLGNITIKKFKSQDTETGDIVVGQIVTLVYDGTNFQMQSELASTTGSGATVRATSPTLVTPVLGVATGTSFNSLTGAAVKSDQTTGTSTIAAVVPGVQQFHASAAKVWISHNGVTDTILASYNVTSVTDNGTGNFTINFTTSFTSGAFGATGMSKDNGSGAGSMCNILSKAAGTINVVTVTPTSPGTGVDSADINVTCFGAQ